MTGSAKTPEPADACILRVEPAGQPRVMVDRQPGDVPDAFGMVFCFNVCSTGSAVFFRSVG